jgi:hypothetical protein
VAAGVSSYDDTTISGETTYAYKLRHTADIDSPDSNTIQQWTGPDLPPTSLSASPSGCASPQNLVEWTNGDASLFTEVWGRNITRSIGYSVRATANPGQTGICATAPGAVTGDTVAFNVRHKLTSFGVDDFSPYYGGSANPQLDEVQTTVP